MGLPMPYCKPSILYSTIVSFRNNGCLNEDIDESGVNSANLVSKWFVKRMVCEYDILDTGN